MKFLRILLLLLHCGTITLNAQLFKDSREMFLEAESYALFEEYNEALPLYLTLLREKSGNDYLRYMVGVCYLHTPGQKERAIPYLQEAILNIDWRAGTASHRTTQAPPDALFYLAQAYHINYQFDKAIEYYNRFKNEANPKIFNLDLVNEFIQASINAKESTATPLFFYMNNLEEPVNSRFSENNPVVSGNEEVIVFTRKLPFYDGVFFSRKVGGEWTEPMDITPMIGSDGDCYPVSLSYDGTELYIYKLDNYLGNLYTSSHVNGEWTRIMKLNENINTKYWESHASVSKDGKTLYFTSNRPGGFGGLDIYVSERGANGDWGPAQNLGNPVNSKFNEETPFITEDGRTLYYSSYGYYNIGGYDVFYTTRLDDGKWTVPLNAGYPISTPDDDLFFYPLKDGRYAYIARANRDKVNAVTDIFRLEIFSDTHPRKFRIMGAMALADNVKITPSSSIMAVNTETGDTVYISQPDLLSGKFDFELAMGKYQIIFTEVGFEKKVLNLNLPVDNPESEIALSTILEPLPPGFDSTMFAEKPVSPWYADTVYTSADIGLRQKQIRISKSEPVEFNLNLERGAKLRVETWMDNRLVKVDTFDVQSRQFSYKMTPLPGRTRLRFFYLDKDNNLVRDEVSIAYVPEIKPEVPATPVINERLQTFYNELLKVTGEDLRTVLLNIDFEKENIETPENLVQYLLTSSATNNYTESDVRLALLRIASKNRSDVAGFLATMIMKSQDPLHSVLKKIDLEKEGITSISQLLKVIDSRTAGTPAGGDALVALATKIALEETSREQQELAILYYEMLKLASPNIRAVLREIEPGKSNVMNTAELIDLLLEKSTQYNYTSGDLENLLVAVIDSKNDDLPALRSRWAGVASPELARLITQTQPTRDTPEFSRYARLISGNAGRANISQLQVLQSLSALAVDESVEARRAMAVLYYNMLRLADGNLKIALQEINLEEKQISTSKELIDYLVNHSDSLNFVQEDVMVLMARISAEKDLQGFFTELTGLSSGNLQKLLKSIDLKRDNITSVDQLIVILMEKAPEYGYSPADILSIVGQLSIARSMGNQMDMLLLKQNLAALGRAEIRLALENLNEDEIIITTPEQLIEYLAGISDSAGYTPDDVWDVVFELGTEGQRDIREIVASLKNLADDRILKALADIEKENLSFNSIKQLMDYLVEKGNEYGYSEEDVKHLILKQALENQKIIMEQKEKTPAGFKKWYWVYLIILLIAIILAFWYMRKAKKE